MPVVLTEGEKEQWDDQGWLDKDGICHFPVDVMGFDPGYRGRIYGSSYEAAVESFKNGWAKFIDSDGAALTLDEWFARYPESVRPDPIKQLFLMHKLPPNNEWVTIKVLGKAGEIKPDVSKMSKFKQLSRLSQFK